MPPSDQDQVLALAALLQALEQVRIIATHGQGDRRRMLPCLDALLGTLDSDVATLYGGREQLYPGLRLLIDHLGQPREAQLTRYMVSVLHLERRISRDRARLRRLVSSLRTAAEQAAYFGSSSHDNVIHNLGEVYSGSISEVRPRIMIQGERAYLEDQRNAAIIRALLLCALRAAGLWRHAGGGRLRLILGRQQLLDAARSQLATT